MERIGVYLRISEDRDGEQTATDRQREDCERYAQSKGWAVADVFEDVDLSAFKRGVKRPEFERMLEAVRAKAIDGVLAWKIDRITRRQLDLVRLDEACEEAGGFIATVVDQIDTRHPTSRFVAELLVAQARMESENASIRLKRKNEEQARQGRPQTGGTRAFGYTRDRMHIDPAEAALIREARDRVFAGESMRGICTDWRERGILTPTGKPWRQTTLRRVLLSAAISGQREYDGRMTAGVWPAIVSAADTVRLRAILTDSARLTRVGPVRRYLLTGFLVCGNCGERLVPRPRGDKQRRYVCARQPYAKNCGKLARLAEPIEEAVVEMILSTLDGLDPSAYTSPAAGANEDALRESLRADEAALEQLSRDHYAEKVISRAEYFAARDVLASRIELTKQQLATSAGNNVLAHVASAPDLRGLWDQASLDRRRAIIAALLDRIVIKPAVRGRNIFDVSLIRPVWRF